MGFMPQIRTNKDTIFAVDVDDVCLNLVSSWLEKYNRFCNDSVKKEDIKSWDIASYVKKCTPEVFYSMLDSGLYSRMSSLDGALQGVNFLRERYRVIFVTSNFGDVGRAKFDRLNVLGFNINKRDFIEASDKSLIVCDYLLDDNVDNVVSAFGFGIIFTQPWNENWNNRSHNVLRVKSWNELVGRFT